MTTSQLIRSDIASFETQRASVVADPQAAIARVKDTIDWTAITNAELCESLITLIEAFETLHDNLGQLGLFADISAELANRSSDALPSQLTIETSTSMVGSLSSKERAASIERVIDLTSQACP